MLVADLSSSQTLLLLLGCLLVLGTVLFTFFEVYRLATDSNRRADRSVEEPDPDIARMVVTEPPTGEPYPHHEDYAGSPGLDQGQITSRIPDEPPLNLRDMWAQWMTKRKHPAYRGQKPGGTANSH
jgi:hypothetical protein